MCKPWENNPEQATKTPRHATKRKSKIKPTPRKKHAKKAAEKIAANSPSDPKTDFKKYRDGWKVKTEYENSESIEIIVYNANKPTLTWLLEKGHIGVDGKRVSGKPHIEKNTDEQAKELLEELKRL